NIEELPRSLAIIGGGVIGVEFATIFASLNVDVTIIEMEDRIIATEEKDASDVLNKSLKRKGVEILTSHQVTKFSKAGKQTMLTTKAKEGKIENYNFDEVLMAVGRKSNINGVENLSLEMNGSMIKVNDYL